MESSKLSLITRGAISGAKRGALYLSLVFAVLWGGIVIFGLITAVPLEIILINAVFGVLISGVVQGACLGAVLGGVQALNEQRAEKKAARLKSWFITGVILGLMLGLLAGTAVSLMVTWSGVIGRSFNTILTATTTGVIVGGLGGALIGLISNRLRDGSE
jgi:hypothetical protein